MNPKLALAAICSRPTSKFYPVTWKADSCSIAIGKERSTLGRRGCFMMEQPGLAVVFWNGQFCYATGTGTPAKRAQFLRILRLIANPETRKRTMPK